MKIAFSASRPSSPVFPIGLVLALFGFGLFFDQVNAVVPQAEPVAQLHAGLARQRAAADVRHYKERTMSTQDEKSVKADHGAKSEVTWDGDGGRQPYGNQGPAEAAQPNGGDEFSEGDRGELSGRNQKQSDEVKKKP